MINQKKLGNFLLKKLVPTALAATVIFGGFAAADTSASPVKTWNFEQNAENWDLSGVWNYPGKPIVSYDSNIGQGSLKLAVDFHTKYKDSWSEVKIHNTTINSSTPLVLNNCGMLTFDFYYAPKNMTNGSFKTKVYMKSDADKEIVNVCPDIDILSARQVEGTNLKKVKVRVPFSAVTGNIIYFDFSVVSTYTNYKGPLYVDNISLESN